MLKGSAPSNEAREHATTLAQNVKGVVAVDNQLKVGG
jgi:osmotically-inducible protein OsmY